MYTVRFSYFDARGNQKEKEVSNNDIDILLAKLADYDTYSIIGVSPKLNTDINSEQEEILTALFNRY